MDDVLWAVGNALVGFIFVLAAVFLVTYFVLFNPRRTTGGWLIWQSIFSLTCIGLVNMVGIHLPDVWWRPGFRAVVYALVAYNFARLVIHLLRRRFCPHKVVTSSDVDEQTLSPKPRVIRRKR